MEAALHKCQLVLLVVPSHAFAQTLEGAAPALPEGVPVAWATKGLDERGGRLLHEVVAQRLDPERALAVISGPTFAAEVAAGLPTAMTVAANRADVARSLAACLHGDRVRAYYTDDLIGVQLGGAVKNVLAIAAGIADGLGFGANSRSALITRGMAEIMRLGEAVGGRRETLMGLAGLGDLVLTCTDNLSRNRRMGLALAQGRSIEAARHEIAQEVEGVRTARAVRCLADRLAVEMPITEQVCRVLYEGMAPQAAVAQLLSREQKSEQS
jgi:glycerol-3-phosphate dehydrogenase (NAD(P)+)